MHLTRLTVSRTPIHREGSTTTLTLVKRAGRFVGGVLLSLWMVLWLGFGALAVYPLYLDATWAGSASEFRTCVQFVAFWGAFWLTSGALAAAPIVLLFARERISLTPDLLRIRLGVGPFGWAHDYDLLLVRNLRVDRWSTQSRRIAGRTALAVDYGAKVVRFGHDLDEEQASEVRSILLDRDARLDWCAHSVVPDPSVAPLVA